MCSLRAYDLDQSMGRMLPKLPVIVHHILQTQQRRTQSRCSTANFSLTVDTAKNLDEPTILRHQHLSSRLWLLLMTPAPHPSPFRVMQGSCERGGAAYICRRRRLLSPPYVTSGITAARPAHETVRYPAIASAGLQEVTITSAGLQEVTITSAGLQEVTITSAGLQEVTITSAGLQEVTITSAGLQEVTITSAGLQESGGAMACTANTRQQDGGTSFTNQKLETNLPGGSSTNREQTMVCSQQSDSRSVSTASLAQWATEFAYINRAGTPFRFRIHVVEAAEERGGASYTTRVVKYTYFYTDSYTKDLKPPEHQPHARSRAGSMVGLPAPKRTDLHSRRISLPDFSHAGIMPDDAAVRQVFSRDPPHPFFFPFALRRCSILAPLQPSSALKTPSGSHLLVTYLSARRSVAADQETRSVQQPDAGNKSVQQPDAVCSSQTQCAAADQVQPGVQQPDAVCSSQTQCAAARRSVQQPDAVCSSQTQCAAARRSVQQPDAVCSSQTQCAAARRSVQQPDAVCSSQTQCAAARRSVQQPDAVCSSQTQCAAARRSVQQPDAVCSSQTQCAAARRSVQQPDAVCSSQRTVSLLASDLGDPGSIPGRATLDFRLRESCRTMPLMVGFSLGSPVSPALSFRRCSILTSITLIGSQDLDVNPLRMSNAASLQETEQVGERSRATGRHSPLIYQRRSDSEVVQDTLHNPSPTARWPCPTVRGW
ncbi:hypothetical protein PR048_007511 [Dryococelus australis]|uniref:Uncharacterized protein n=1 Tax=Dryococelus australis TaxID=614101 RepID=A0ABQ9HUJ3_9NEOP|nr:hypothetical protein PR048_007511 [Dryococelus australis]